MANPLAGADPRTLRTLTLGVVVLLAAAIFTYGVWPELKGYRAAVESRATLRDVAANDFQLDKTLESLRQNVIELRRRLHGDMANLPTKEMQGYIIGRLQSISWRNRVDLVGVNPKEGQPVENFREILFEVELSGDYFDLYEWLREVGTELGFVVVKQYELTPVSQGPDRVMLGARLTMAVYRAQG